MRTLAQDISSRNTIIGILLCAVVIPIPARAERKWQQSSSGILTAISGVKKSDEIRLLAVQAHALNRTQALTILQKVTTTHSTERESGRKSAIAFIQHRSRPEPKTSPAVLMASN